MLRLHTTRSVRRGLNLLCFTFPLLFAVPGISQDPRNEEERQQGIDLYHQQKYGPAGDILKKAVGHDKTDDVAWSYLGLALLHQPKRIKDASKAFETALKLRPICVGSCGPWL